VPRRIAGRDELNQDGVTAILRKRFARVIL
jgi:hypothetical protein